MEFSDIIYLDGRITGAPVPANQDSFRLPGESMNLVAKIKARLGAGKPGCVHLEQIQQVTPSAQGCEACLALGDEWVQLRLCLTCGHVGCCDNSKNKHATRHFHATGHPVIQSFQPGEDWLWCYVDNLYMD
jgi:hypothetical protein